MAAEPDWHSMEKVTPLRALDAHSGQLWVKFSEQHTYPEARPGMLPVDTEGPMRRSPDWQSGSRGSQAAGWYRHMMPSHTTDCCGPPKAYAHLQITTTNGSYY
ncbi:Hypothetical predicted protein [Pelobates cultripes]|uniref:Uncharacterized protein n=1 Tax=Pelobates cultripes TaxID=61616 RepID=A0AAD1VS37_PELCU|nr:Hypothetical predicted protein [Pelobates cultripes]